MYVQNELTVLQYRVRSKYTEYINSVFVDIHKNDVRWKLQLYELDEEV